MTNAIRLLIVDDHPVVRTGISGMLTDHPDFTIVAEAENGEQAIRIAAEQEPDVILMDLRMPVLDGVQATRAIKAQHPDIAILILTTYDRDRDILPSINAGAIGYLLKDTPRDDLYRAIRAAARGESVLDSSVAARVMQHMREPRLEQELSEREIDVLKLVSRGQSNKAIGKTLHISEATVKTHLIHVFNKLQVSDRTAAVTRALELGILSLD